ncbi:MAG: HRDC domain-containing protein, partial [Pseudomonadales bacterium]
GEASLQLREEASRPERTRRAAARKGGGAAEPADDALFEALRRVRRELADAQGVPPYVIFHDATLAEMTRVMPRNGDELMTVAGVGAAKLERYGKRFLDEIAGHVAADQTS